MRHLSMFLAAAIIIWACQTCCRFFLYITVRWNCSLYYYFLFNFIDFSFFFWFVTRSKVGYGLLGISGFFSQRAHNRNFCGSHPRVTFLATHKLFLFSSQYDDSSAISCCPHRTSCTTPTEACCPGDARISQSKEVKISCPGHSS